MDHKIKKNKKAYTFSDMYRNLAIDVPYSLYIRILDEMCNVILDHVLNRSEGFKMPFGLGFIQIGKYKPKSFDSSSLSVDYKASKELGKTIYHLNEHSNMFKYRMYWSRVPQTFPDRYRYQLCLVRENKRYLAQLIFNKQDYLEINDIQLYKV